MVARLAEAIGSIRWKVHHETVMSGRRAMARLAVRIVKRGETRVGLGC